MLSYINVYYEAVHYGIYPIPESYEELYQVISPLEVLPAEESIIGQVHGGRKVHWGTQATWIKMKEVFPGHQVTFKAVQEYYLQKCPTCQRFRLLQGPAHTPVIRHLKPTHPRVGMDTVTISPRDGCWAISNFSFIFVLCTRPHSFLEHKDYLSEQRLRFK